MLSSIFIALLQAVAGDPATGVAAETRPAEAASANAEAAPRTERRRVCRDYEAVTGGRLSQRRCRWEEVPVRAPEATSAETAGAASNDATSEAANAEATDPAAGGTSAAASPSPPAPQ